MKAATMKAILAAMKAIETFREFAHALDPEALLRRVQDAIEPHINREVWDRIAREEKGRIQRDDMAAITKHWPIAVAAAKGAA